MLNAEEILKNITADNISKFLLDGYLDDRTFQQRSEEEYNHFINTLKRKFTADQVEDILSYMNLYIIATEEISFDIGLKCGVRLLYELLNTKK